MRKKNCSKWIAKFIILHHSTILQAAKFIFLIFTILHWNLYAPWHLVGSWLCSGQQNCCSSQEGMRVIWYHLEPRRGEEYCSEECCLWDCWFIRLWGQVLGSMWAIACGLFTYLSHTVITLGLLISLLFPVNCSYLSQQSSLSVSPILLSSPAVRKQEEAKGEDTRSLVFSGNSKLRNTFSKPWQVTRL